MVSTEEECRQTLPTASKMVFPLIVASQRSTGVGDMPRERLMLRGLDEGVVGSVSEAPSWDPEEGEV